MTWLEVEHQNAQTHQYERGSENPAETNAILEILEVRKVDTKSV